MQALVQVIRHALVMSGFLIAVAFGGSAYAAPYAAMVMDARTGEVLHATNHDTKLHPASLTKMMTLYVAFEAIKHGELTLDTMITVSRRATSTECVCLGLRAGQRISMRNLIRAAALRSANDAAVVIAEGVSGSVEEFARRMTRTARAMGMNSTTFHNPHGLTQAGHISTARDMTVLGRQLFFDYPEYYNIFSRRSENAGVSTVANTNRRFLDGYAGADGIKTGFTRAAGFNLTASARRGNKHIITTVFGGTSTAARNARVAELMDLGFSRAKDRVASRAPARPAYQGRGAGAMVSAEPEVMSPNATNRTAAAKTIRLQTAVRTSPRPRPRPDRTTSADLLAVVKDSVDAAVAQVAAAAPAATTTAIPAIAPPPRPANLAVASAAPSAAPSAPNPVTDLAAAQAAGFSIAAPEDLAALNAPVTPPAPDTPVQSAQTAETVIAADVTAEVPVDQPVVVAVAETVAPPVSAPPEIVAQSPTPQMMWSGAADTVTLTAAPAPLGTAMTAQIDPNVTPASPSPAPATAGSGIILTRAPSVTDTPAPDAAPAQPQVAMVQPQVERQVVSRLSTSDSGRVWAVSLGEFSSRSAAERGLITVKMAEASALGNGISRIRQTRGRYEALFAGLNAQEAERACLRLQARGMECSVSNM